MPTEIKVPALGESVTSATVSRWLKQAGEAVAQDEPLVELETDKVTVEVPAPGAGVLTEITAPTGSEVEIGAVLGRIDGAGTATHIRPPAPASAPVARQAAPPPEEVPEKAQPPSHPPERASVAPAPAAPLPAPPSHPPEQAPPSPVAPLPAAAKLLEEKSVSAAAIGPGSGKDGRITKGDVLAFLNRPAPPPAPAAPVGEVPAKSPPEAEPGEQRVRMTRLRRTIAIRLKEAQNTAAMLTTFNEVDMSAVIALRAEYRQAFEKKYAGTRLGFMSFFVRSAVAALQEFPAVNAEIDGEDIIYKHFVHMGIAVGGPSGLVVPVIRNVERMGFAEVEQKVADFGERAKAGTLKLEELTEGTFSITNGGVYGSLMSTPILNPPQSAILGMHKIEDRPVAVAGKMEIRPMMYLALTYDHRVVDGREAVLFLVRLKEGIEDPRRLLLGV
ncbi:MAG: 2-oxoglutarate dehydrogenase complex dihydrolipoyllysine-residue succinyltransferase [Acetobacteraceae bacterium]